MLKHPGTGRSGSATRRPVSVLVGCALLWALSAPSAWAQASSADAPRPAVTYSEWQAAEAAKAKAKAEMQAKAAAAPASAPAVLQPLRPAEPPRGLLPEAQMPDLAPNAKQVHEDKLVRIEESKQRGQVRDVQVKSKLPHVPGYEIQVGGKGRDPSQDTGSRGKRTWSVFDF